MTVWCNQKLIEVIVLWSSLTCPVPQCTDVESAHPRRYVGPPTSPQRLAGRVTERLPSWRKALSDFDPHSRTSLWPQSAPTLQHKQHKVQREEMWQNPIWALWLFQLFQVQLQSVFGDSPSSLVLGPVPLSTSSRAPGSLWGLSLNKGTRSQKTGSPSIHEPNKISQLKMKISSHFCL